MHIHFMYISVKKSPEGQTSVYIQSRMEKLYVVLERDDTK